MCKTAVILCGGLGERLKPFTNVIPKPLLPIGDKAVLEIQIEKFANFGFNKIFLATNYKADYIEKFLGNGERYGIDIEISHEEKPLGTAGPLKLLHKKITEDSFVVINGDILCSLNYNKFISYAKKQQTELTVAIKKIITPYDFGNIIFEGDLVKKIEEKPNIVTYAMAGIYMVDRKLLDRIPENIYFGMDRLMLDMLEEKIPISKYEMEEYWLDIGRMDDYEKAQEIFGKR